MTGKHKKEKFVLYLLVPLILVLSTALVFGEVESSSVSYKPQNKEQEQMLQSLQQNPDLLKEERFMTFLDLQLIYGNVQIVNTQYRLLRAWGQQKGVFFEPGAQIDFYNGAFVRTKGPKSTLFHPESFRGLVVFEDGSVLLPEKYQVSGFLDVDEQGWIVKGSVKDSTGNLITSQDNEKFQIVKDGTITAKGKIQLKTRNGIFSLSGSLPYYLIMGSGSDESFRLGIPQSEEGKRLDIITPLERSFFLEKGEATIADPSQAVFSSNARFGFEGPRANQKNIFSSRKSVRFCFSTCNAGSYDPDTYDMSSIELLTPDDENYQLKITAIDGNSIEASLKNPDYQTIWADARHQNEITIRQKGKIQRLGRNKIYLSQTLVREGSYTVQGFEYLLLSGNPILVPDNEVQFDENHELVQGTIHHFAPGNTKSVGLITPDDDFSLVAYNEGKPVSYTSVGEVTQKQDVPESSPSETENFDDGDNGGNALSGILREAKLTLPLGDDDYPFKTYGDPNSDVIYFFPHGDETISLDSVKRLIDETGGYMIAVDHQGRNLPFHYQGKQYSFDPNRIFSNQGLESQLRHFPASRRKALRLVAQKFRDRLLDHLGVSQNSNRVIVSLHTNSGKKYLKNWQRGGKYRTDAAQVIRHPRQSLQNFYFVTDTADFNILSNRYNAVLQSPSPREDGSLSVTAGSNNMRYVNIEVADGDAPRQAMMLNDLHALLLKESEG